MRKRAYNQLTWSFQVVRNASFRTFEMSYRANSIIYPDMMNKFIFNQTSDETFLYSLYEDKDLPTLGSPTDVIEREILLSHPVETNKIRIDFIEYMEELNMKVDIIGMRAKERYRLNPYLDKQVISRGA